MRFSITTVNNLYGIHDNKSGAIVIPKYGTFQEAEKNCVRWNLLEKVESQIKKEVKSGSRE